MLVCSTLHHTGSAKSAILMFTVALMVVVVDLGCVESLLT